MSYSDAPDAPTGKRRRISLACSACRTRKSRCDGSRPKCSSCEELGFDCIYINPASGSNVIIGKEYLSGLEHRLKIVEQDIRTLRAQQDNPRQHARFEDNFEDEPRGQSAASPSHTRTLQSEEVEVNRDELQDSFDNENDADGMGAMVFSAEEDCGFFGPSSNIAFMRHVSRAMARTNRSMFATGDSFSPNIPLDSAVISISQPASPSARASATMQSSNAANRSNVNIHALPPEATIRSLIERYFGDTGLLFPYIHEQAFLDTYNEIKANDFTKIRRTWLGLLNMIMAMATSTTVENGLSADKRAQASDIYYLRAAGLCEKQIMRGTSLEIVQYLLLTSQYLQGTQRSVEAWTVHGLAVKGALQLGLHSTAAASRFSSLDQEFRKRTWFGCVVLDRTLSMTFGRPATIPDDYIRIPLPRSLLRVGNSEEYDANDHEREVSVDFFNATITLYKIMWNVINELYGGNIGCGTPTTVLNTVSQLFSIEQQLGEWQLLLPPSLGLCNVNDLFQPPDLANSIPSPIDRFQVILKLRYCNLRTLLHRPILVKFLDIIGKASPNSDAGEVNLLQQIGSNSIQICVQSSMDIVAIVRAMVTGSGAHRSRLGAWWFSLYYTFNAALVIFASFLILRDRSANGAIRLPLAVSELDLQRSLIDAALALRQLDCKNRMVDRCAVYLEQLASVSETLSTSSGFDNRALPNTYNEPSATNVPSLYPNGQMFGSMMMNASPLGMDLGEFLLEGDLEFLNHITSTQQAQIINRS
ncbi:uncharacterized protein LY89DRAFT_707337 [Mollisia scopiformis]|uniref:Zn(2)-C6 fungal-type domain-containing protein n=1 Tax=Mollisia scopiformis TaxID=149040 RepID=A0A194X9S1_MOLSC|nr:uncharacterized protein LY89DRAFT_707337 [Mollisia scopiformis]KUJ16925.1 hypothetical protein LY89DRAFT_707337 [Mollisia scopiformis]